MSDKVYVLTTQPGTTFYDPETKVKVTATKPVLVDNKGRIAAAISGKHIRIVPESEAKELLRTAEELEDKAAEKSMRKKILSGSSGKNFSGELLSVSVTAAEKLQSKVTLLEDELADAYKKLKNYTNNDAGADTLEKLKEVHSEKVKKLEDDLEVARTEALRFSNFLIEANFEIKRLTDLLGEEDLGSDSNGKKSSKGK